MIHQSLGRNANGGRIPISSRSPSKTNAEIPCSIPKASQRRRRDARAFQQAFLITTPTFSPRLSVPLTVWTCACSRSAAFALAGAVSLVSYQCKDNRVYDDGLPLTCYSIGDAFEILLAWRIVRKAEKIDGGLPMNLKMRMIIYILIDFAVGTVPIVGDLAGKTHTRARISLRNCSLA